MYNSYKQVSKKLENITKSKKNVKIYAEFLYKFLHNTHNVLILGSSDNINFKVISELFVTSTIHNTLNKSLIYSNQRTANNFNPSVFNWFMMHFIASLF